MRPAIKLGAVSLVGFLALAAFLGLRGERPVRRPAGGEAGRAAVPVRGSAALSAGRGARPGPAPPRFLGGPPLSGRPFWRELTMETEPAAQAARLAERIGLDPEQRTVLEGIFPTLSRTASAAIEHGDAELAGAVEREARRVLVALSDSDEQSRRVDEVFPNLTENRK
jgi:hypothetical protein